MGVLNSEQLKEVLKMYNIKTTEDVHMAVKDLMKDIIQASLEGELDNTLGYGKYETGSKTTDNTRNGKYPKKVKSTFGNIDLEIPRDRQGEYQPQIVPKGQSDISKIESQIISMYGKGMSTRDINKHMKDIYGIEVSAEMVSQITNKLLPIIQAWQNRPLQKLYPIVYMDAIHLNIKEDRQVIKKAVYAAIGIDANGMKDVLGIWIGGNESAKFWLNVLNDIKNRGVQDVLICCIDGLSGFEEAIQAVFPKTEIQRCIVHQVRYCCKFVNYKDRKEFCADMKRIYTAVNEEAGLEELVNFEKKWGNKYQYAVRSWENNWTVLSSFFKFPDEIRRLIYTTNPIESLNSSIRKVASPKKLFPTDDAALKVIYMAVQDRIKKWTMRTRNWHTIINQLYIYFQDRMEGVI